MNKIGQYEYNYTVLNKTVENPLERKKLSSLETRQKSKIKTSKDCIPSCSYPLTEDILTGFFFQIQIGNYTC